MESVDNGFGLGREDGVGRDLDRVEALRVAGFGQELLGARRIERIRGRRPVELEVARDDARRGTAEPEVFRVAERFPIDRQVDREPDPAVGPRRLRVPLLGEHHPLAARGDDDLEREAGRSPHFLGIGPPEPVRDVRFAALQLHQPRRFVGHRLQDDALHRRHLPPVAVIRFDHELDAGVEGHEAIGPGADRRLLEPVVADALDVLLRHDPGGTGGRCRVERHEVRPRLLEPEPDALRVDDLDRGHPRFQRGGAAALVALERELHVVGRERYPLAEHELVGEPVVRDRPRFGEARRPRVARHRFHERVVERVQGEERRDHPGVSAGSNHVGAIETVAANVICDASAARAGCAATSRWAARVRTSAPARAGHERRGFTGEA